MTNMWSFSILRLRDHLKCAASLGDFLLGGSAKGMGVNGELVLELAIAENFDPVSGAPDEAMRPQQLRSNRLTRGEHVQFLKVNHRVLDSERIVKTALRNAAVQRHLPAFKSAPTRIPTAGLLALVARTRRLAELRTHASAHAHFALARATGRPEGRQRNRVVLFFLFVGHTLLHHFHEMPHLVDHSAHRRRILALDHLMHSAQAQAADRLAHVIGTADEAPDPLHFHSARALLFACHAYSPAAFSTFSVFSALAALPLNSSTVFERVSATCLASFRPSSAAKVALTTLCGLEVPSD